MKIQTPENQLIIASARYPLGTVQSAQVAAYLGARLDWDYLLMRAGNHGLTPLMFAMLTELELMEYVPERQRDILKKSYLASLLRNKRLYDSLAKVLHEFAERSVPTVLLKGAALCLDTYDDMALRPFGDLDILIPRERVNECRSVMEALGYKLVKGIYFPIPDDQNDELGCEWAYVQAESIVELHWNLVTRLSPFRIDVESLWEGTREVEAEGERALALSLENQLLHLCLHQYKHHWEHLRDLTDIALFIDRHGEAMNWQKLVRDGHRQGVGRCVYYCLALAEKLLDAPVPQEAMRIASGSSSPRRLAGVFQDFIVDNIFEENLPRRFWELMLVEGNRSRVCLLGQIFAHPFPRKGDEDRREIPKASNLSGRLVESLKSIYYYRKIFFSIPAHLFRALRRRS